ncbi:regulatory protein RecX [Sphingosinicella rhizophila]|uniref:Regulatory protein RecX n=1 Tax=Sphingosinicella rhizophila TaxID=3050082 RepID=A0ABU3Q4M8_9SPHN|nr:RecX family transcriptional regulator [Sphingosinicella sp. GR2756]MDT9598368.1 RecX family transcriptional regulator [Sphingosinicella sp. GR2756]
MAPGSHRKPIDQAELERLGLAYAGRYATTRAKLAAYLSRKVRERGWAEAGPPQLDHLVEKFASLGYVNDGLFASGRASALLRRGYGRRRVDQALRAAGIAEEDTADARRQVEEGEYEAALRYARRKHIGPFATAEIDGDARRKAFAAMLRAGHSMDMVRKLFGTRPGDEPDGF